MEQLSTATVTSKRVSGRADRLPGDEGGHIWATMFGGPGECINIIAMLEELNSRGDREYFVLEARLRARLEGGEHLVAEAFMERPTLADGHVSARPDHIAVRWYTATGETDTVFFDNRPIDAEGRR